MKHTPGPWNNSGYCKGKAYTHPNTYHIRNGEGHIVAAIPDEKNVSIIKAAPDLLAACKLAQKYIRKMVADGVETAIPPIVAFEKIESAIKNAETG